MKTVHIRDKLAALNVSVDMISFGDFDRIGELCAKRERKSNDPNYKKFGAYFRAQYERGILLYYLIRQHNLTSVLEIGTGRGYGTLCCAKAFHDSGTKGKIVTIDPVIDERHHALIRQVYPREWLSCVTFVKGTSAQAVPALGDESFSLIYIDGDHSYEGTKLDWEMTKGRFTSFLLFDDYHLPSKDDPGIQCRAAIDEVNWRAEGCKEPELVILDRRLFRDDRGFPDDAIDYGQVLFTRDRVTLDNEW